MTNLDSNIVDIPHDGSTGRVNGHTPNAEVVDRERLFVNGVFGHVCFCVPVSASEGSVGVEMRNSAEGGRPSSYAPLMDRQGSIDTSISWLL